MAAAEARAAWQRAANRYLVQEDAKRAPKLAGCPSSSVQQYETNSNNASNRLDPSAANFMPLNRTPMNSTFPQQTLKQKVDMDDYFFQEELKDWKLGDRLINQKKEKGSLDLETPWVGGNKCEPWWRISDRDELALLVAQKSLEQFENCDLPRPTQTFGCLDRPDGNRHFSLSAGPKLHTSICNTIDCPHHSFSSGSIDEKYWSVSEVGHSPCDTNKQHSRDPNVYTTTEDLQENMIPESESSRAQLLEALRHSQTRARKAENAAQKACDEKEDIIKILFRQASHLFAYKQCLHILQSEIKDHQLTTLFPNLPWMPLKRNARKQKGRKKHKKCSLCKYAVAFALAGAGLLLGWTLGWLFPQF